MPASAWNSSMRASPPGCPPGGDWQRPRGCDAEGVANGPAHPSVPSQLKASGVSKAGSTGIPVSFGIGMFESERVSGRCSVFCTTKNLSSCNVMLNALHSRVVKERVLQIRVSDDEKRGFSVAATLAGIPLSSWVRERLRLAAIRNLENAGQKIPFVKPIPLSEPDG